MKLVEARKIEDCFDGGYRLEYRFDGPVAEAFMRRLAEGGRLDFFPDFPKPFFKIFRDDGLQIKGIVTGLDFEVYFPRDRSEERIAAFALELEALLAPG